MPRDIPSDHQQDILDPFSGSAWFPLVEIVVPGFATIRLARNKANVTYDGDVYTKYNFDLRMGVSLERVLYLPKRMIVLLRIWLTIVKGVKMELSRS